MEIKKFSQIDEIFKSPSGAELCVVDLYAISDAVKNLEDAKKIISALGDFHNMRFEDAFKKIDFAISTLRNIREK
jgi:hypothetical protein